jgi:hypothetical protein
MLLGIPAKNSQTTSAEIDRCNWRYVKRTCAPLHDFPLYPPVAAHDFVELTVRKRRWNTPNTVQLSLALPIVTEVICAQIEAEDTSLNQMRQYVGSGSSDFAREASCGVPVQTAGTSPVSNAPHPIRSYVP